MDKTLVKGLALIEVLAANSEPRGVTSLARELNMTKSNVHRLLNTLVSHKFARRTEGGSYELTTKIWELGIMVRSRLSLIQVSQRHMAYLADVTGESAHLSTLEGLEALYIDKIESKHPVTAYTHFGGRAPAWCVATGKAMLAFRLENFDAIRRELKPFSPNSIVDVAKLKQEFSSIRTQGHAINRGEWREDVFGIGAPIRDGTGTIVGAVGISGPSTRFKPKQIRTWAKIVVDTAHAISTAMGYSESIQFFEEKQFRASSRLVVS